jgi:SAM-dependent methyltransferase
MRNDVREFVSIAARAFRLAGPVYEFGSYLVEGQGDLGDLRSLFAGSEYVGCDMRAGAGVDRVEDLAHLGLPDGAAQTIICVDTLEHVFEIRRAVDEMIRVLAPGGVLLITAPFDFHIHNHPGDYWRLTPSCLDRLLSPLAAVAVGSQGIESSPHTVFAIAAKAPVDMTFAQGYERLATQMRQHCDAQAAAVPWSMRAKQWIRRWAQGRGERRRAEEYYCTRFALNMRISTAAMTADSSRFNDITAAGKRFERT